MRRSRVQRHAHRRASARPEQIRLGAESADKWKPLGMPDRLDSQVDVQLGPIKVVCGWEFDVQNFANRDIPEPGKIGEWQKLFLFFKQEPEAVLRDVGYLNWESAYAKRCGCHFRAPELFKVLRYFHAAKGQSFGQVQSPAQAKTWPHRFDFEHGHAFSSLPARKSKIERRLRERPSDS